MKRLPLFFSFLLALACYIFLARYDFHKNSAVPIRSIAQTGPVREGLKTDYLAQLLHLSKDCPKPLSTAQAEEKLKACPLIQTVEVKTLNPETLYIDYTLKKPTFLLSDAKNVAIDPEGNYLPLTPFYTPKNLPALFLGLSKPPSYFGEPVPKRQLQLAKTLIKKCEHVECIDLSHLEETTLGKKEIILTLHPHKGVRHYLRLTPRGYERELSHYFSIQERLAAQSAAIDLRTSGLAFLTPVSCPCAKVDPL